METRRLKNIAILILLLLNLFLLLLLGYQYLQARRDHADAVEQLSALFAADRLTLSRQADLSQPPLQPMTLSRDTDTEAAMAAFLLGSEVSPVSQGGGIYSYSAGASSIQFRSGGSFDGSRLSLDVEDISAFTREFFSAFDYIETDHQITGGSGSITATQHVDGVPITGCSVALTFDAGTLTTVSGAHISPGDAITAGSDDQLTAITALVRFLDHRRSAGVVCRQVENIHCVYKLEVSSSLLRLMPVWQIETDTYTYFVDCSGGEVSRQA